MRRFAQLLTLSLGVLLIAAATPAALMAQQSSAAGWTPELAMKVKNILPFPRCGKLRTIHEITRSGTKRALSSSHFVCFRGSSYSSKNGPPHFSATCSRRDQI